MLLNCKLRWMAMKERIFHANIRRRMAPKRCIALALLVMMMVSGAAIGMQAYASLPKYGLVTASSLMLRAKATTKSDSIDVIPNGGVVRIFRQSSSDEDWYQCYYDGQEGYVLSKYLRFDVSDDEIEASSGRSSSGSSSRKETKVEIPSTALRNGDKNSYVKNMQKELRDEGYDIDADGIYGDATEEAVLDYQKEVDLTADGLAGVKTLTKLFDGNVKIVKTSPRESSDDDDDDNNDFDDDVELADWWGRASSKFGRGDTAKVTDVKTGKSYRVKRKGGTNHADCEPASKEDTAIMKKIYGGAWSWDRRAVIVEVNGYAFAASQNGMPHGSAAISDNGFSGHFCIHFKNSRTHGSNRVDGDHQSMVKSAYNAFH